MLISNHIKGGQDTQLTRYKQYTKIVSNPHWGASMLISNELAHNPQPRIFPVGRSSKMYGEACVFFEHRGGFASIAITGS